MDFNDGRYFVAIFVFKNIYHFGFLRKRQKIKKGQQSKFLNNI